ncbi:MAG: RICIN domain-containing protein [Isosphaeraceae bacterium]
MTYNLRTVILAITGLVWLAQPNVASAGRWVWHFQGINSGWQYEHDASDYSTLSEPPQGTKPRDGAPRDHTNQVLINENIYYRITNNTEAGKSLDIVNDARDNKPIMANTGNFTGQMWKFEAVGAGYYRITNNFQPGKSLDIINDNSDSRLIMSKTSNYSGQHWKLSPLGNGTYRILSRWKPDKSLTLTKLKNGEFYMWMYKTTNIPGQQWVIR